MGAAQPAAGEGGTALLALYDRALPQVYGYLVSRCGSPALAEDLTAETFLAAVAALQLAAGEPIAEEPPWDEQLDATRAGAVLPAASRPRACTR